MTDDGKRTLCVVVRVEAEWEKALRLGGWGAVADYWRGRAEYWRTVR